MTENNQETKMHGSPDDQTTGIHLILFQGWGTGTPLDSGDGGVGSTRPGT
jgi:hypothetical protein